MNVSLRVLVWFGCVNLLGCSVGKVNEPNYEVLQEISASSVQLRRYDEVMLASTVIEHRERNVAARQGFRPLFDYIDGQNQDAEGNSVKIEMTAPVMQRMLAPNQWQVVFVLPPRFSQENTPTPLAEQVTITENSQAKYAVITFSGRTTDGCLADYEAKLREVALAQQWHIISTPVYAFYNRPWTLPMFRRNEIMFKIE